MTNHLSIKNLLKELRHKAFHIINRYKYYLKNTLKFGIMWTIKVKFKIKTHSIYFLRITFILYKKIIL